MDPSEKSYSFPRVALMLAFSVLIGLGGAQCSNPMGDTNPRPACHKDEGGNIDCPLQSFLPSPGASK